MDEKPKKNWKGITSLVIYGGIMLLSNGRLHVQEFIEPVTDLCPRFFNVVLMAVCFFGLLCAISAIRTEKVSGLLLGGLAALLWVDWFAGGIDFYLRYSARHGFR
jgi:hypothetical protein